MVKFALVSARHGSDVLASEYRDFLQSSGLAPEELDHIVLDSAEATVGDISSYAGIFVGGSPFNVADDEFSAEQEHVQQELLSLADRPIPMMFVCFGSSLLTYGRGGIVSRSHPESAGLTTVQLTPEGREDDLLAGCPDEFIALTGHTESVDKLPERAVLLATGPTCPVQMFRLDSTTWACQFHAEMDSAGMIARMGFYRTHGYFDPEEFDAIAQRITGADTSHAQRVLRNFVELCRS